MVLNAKGGCGKTTIATNLAALFAGRGHATALIDHDPQESAGRWLGLRDPCLPVIDGVRACAQSSGVTRAFQMRVPPGTERVVIDTPAGVRGFELTSLVKQAHVILVPVLPSDADTHAAARFIGSLLLEARIRSLGVRMGVVANRVRERTLMYASLKRFLFRLELPMVACLRDTQRYARAAEQGMGLVDVHPPSLARDELQRWTRLLDWLELTPEGLPRAPAQTYGGTAASGRQ